MSPVNYDDEPETMRELRKIKRDLAEELKGKSKDELIAFFHTESERFKKETGLKLPRLQKSIK